MARSILVHNKDNCGGDVLGVLNGFNLSTPYFGISYGNLRVNRFEFLSEDFEVITGGKECSLIYVCKKCKHKIDDIEKEISTICGCCGDTFNAGNILVTDYIPLICEKCMDNIKKGVDTKLIQVLEMPTRIRRKTLAETLQLKFKI